jgi:hypothetical protein
MHVESQISGCPILRFFLAKGGIRRTPLKAGSTPASKVTVSNQLPFVIPTAVERLRFARPLEPGYLVRLDKIWSFVGFSGGAPGSFFL